MISRLIRTVCLLAPACWFAVTALAQTPPNVRLNTDDSPFLQNEEQVWINLTDSLNVVADWRDFRLGFRRVGVGVSTDGGATWFDQLVDPMIFTWQSDPVLVGDRSGRFFMNMLDFDPSANQSSHIVVYTSTNGGVFWRGPVALQKLGPYFEDKQFTAVDRTGGPFDGYYYCSWTRFPDVGRNRMLLVRSTDGGLSFDDTVTVGPPLVGTACGTWDQGQFSIPIVNTDGSLHVFWQGVHLDSTGGSCQGAYAAIRRNVSFDGGASFVGDEVAFFINLEYASVDGGINVYGMPAGDADISGGPHDGTLYIAQTQFVDDISTETDVQARKSTDNGLTWSSPVVVNDDPPGRDIDQFHPWLYVNEDGVVVLIFYDQRQDPVNHYLFDCYFAASFDGGETYTTNYRLSSVSSNPGNLAASSRVRPPGPEVDRRTGLLNPEPVQSPMAGLIGEYIGVHSRHDFNVAVWTDSRDGTQDVYSARFVTPLLPPRLYDPPAGWVTLDSSISFRWSTCWHETEDSYRLEVSEDSTFAVAVTRYADLPDNAYAPGGYFTSGRRFWRVKAFRAGGDSSDYSPVRDFTASCQVAAAPQLQAPPAGGTLSDSSVNLAWSAVPGAAEYRVQLAPGPGFSPLLLDTAVATNALALTGLSQDSAHYFWRVNATNACGTGGWAQADFTIVFCPILATGDINVSGSITSADIVLLVNYVFKSGAQPQPLVEAGDVDCSGSVNSADIIKLVNYTFKGGLAPCDACSLL